ncbi:hypothetical protein QVD17_08999 [Tagetes erecta]|uniref:Uncharacterized protein n=1 Tax=Tagetes erecta TaxID=13708 RepID=A0AAD8P3I8_TARER|nr:hypothetical protein QVD17_08999 [Tagetes erecta]
MGFGKLVNFRVDGIPSKLGYYVVDCFDPEETVLNLDVGKIYITAEKIQDILGLTNEGKTVEANSDETFEHYMEEWQKCYGDKKVTTKEIVIDMYVNREPNLQFQLNFLMLFEATWFSATNLVYKDTWKIGPSAHTFTGPLTLLTLIYLDGMKIPTMKPNNIVVPMRVWNMFNMQLREEKEIKGGGFGKGELVNQDERQTSQEEYKEMLESLFYDLRVNRSQYARTIMAAMDDFPDYDWAKYDE